MIDGPEPALRIFTDASWNPPKRVLGSWGVVIVWQDRSGQLQHEIHAAEFKEKPPCTVTAELFAVANGLHMAVAAAHIKPGQHVQVLTDCQPVAGFLEQDTPNDPAKSTAAGRQTVAECLADLSRRGVSVSFAWTPSHSWKASDPTHTDAWFNHLADQAAAKANSYRAELRLGRNARRKSANRKAQLEALQAHGLPVACNTKLRKAAVSMGLHKRKPGSKAAAQVIAKLADRFGFGPPHPRKIAANGDGMAAVHARRWQSRQDHARAREDAHPSVHVPAADPAHWEGWNLAGEGVTHGA